MKVSTSHILFRWASGIFMMLVLVWLTVSTPFVNGFQQQLVEREYCDCDHHTDPEAAECNPFANTTEEKTESSKSLNFSEEYLHEYNETIHTLDDLLKHANAGHCDLYLAFHGELISPPPEA